MALLAAAALAIVVLFRTFPSRRLIALDLAGFDSSHQVNEGESQIRKRTALGGAFTAAFVMLAVALAITMLLQSNEVVIAALQPRSPSNHAMGSVEVVLVAHGAVRGACSAQFVSHEVTGFKGSSSSSSSLPVKPEYTRTHQPTEEVSRAVNLDLEEAAK